MVPRELVDHLTINTAVIRYATAAVMIYWGSIRIVQIQPRKPFRKHCSITGDHS